MTTFRIDYVRDEQPKTMPYHGTRGEAEAWTRSISREMYGARVTCYEVVNGCDVHVLSVGEDAPMTELERKYNDIILGRRSV